VACHGEMGKGGISAALVGGGPLTTISGAQKTIANFWPYPTTVFDIIRACDAVAAAEIVSPMMKSTR
jgi:cytochrome c